MHRHISLLKCRKPWQLRPFHGQKEKNVLGSSRKRGLKHLCFVFCFSYLGFYLFIYLINLMMLDACNKQESLGNPVPNCGHCNAIELIKSKI